MTYHDAFLDDLGTFGGARAMVRLRHRERVRDFKWRQHELAAVGFMFTLFLLATQITIFAALAVLVFTTAERECRRMCKVGRYWQTGRSVEVIGI